MSLNSLLTDTTDDIQDKDLWKIARWVAEIVLYDREAQSWNKQRRAIIDRYKDKRTPVQTKGARYNVLWANTQTLLPALYARNPKPDIQRRFKDADPVGRVTSDVLERSVSYFCDTDHFASTIRQSVLDYLLPGRGTVWVRYVPHLRKANVEVTDDAVEGEDTEAPEIVDYEEVVTDYVHCDDFGYNICRTWEEVFCVWRIVYLDRTELVRRFGEEKGNAVPLDHRPKDNNDRSLDDGIGKATIYELWDSKRKVAVWFHKDLPEALDLRPDPLKLDGFFPCPRPLLTNLCNDSLIPVPDYKEYQDQALELDSLTARVSSITKSLKVAGVYDSSAQGISRLLSEGVENQLIPVEQWAIFAEKGGLDGAISMLPIKDIASALMTLYEVRERVKHDMWEITGISDIVRGESDPNETATAQQLKSSFATNRISDRQREVQRFVREVIRIMVDVICNHFQLETIKTISGVRLLSAAEKQAYQSAPAVPGGASGMPAAPPQQPPPPPSNTTQDQLETMLAEPSWEDVEQLLRNNALRCFRIDIETDSTIKADEDAEKSSRIEFLQVLGPYMEKAVMAGQSAPELIPFMAQTIGFVARAFPVGKELEGSLNVAIQKLEKAASQPQQPQPDPEMEKVRAQMQMEQQKMQAQQQADQQKMQHEQQMAQLKMQTDTQMQQMKIQADAQTEQIKAQSQAAVRQHLNQMEDVRRQHEIASEMQMEKMKAELEGHLELQKAHIQAAASIEVARIGAKADDGAEAEAREASGE